MRLTAVHSAGLTHSLSVLLSPNLFPSQTTWIILAALICHGFDYTGMFLGTSLFFVRVNLLHVIAHFFGGTVTAIYIEQAWQYQYLWYIVGICNMTTALAEIGVLIAMYVLKIVIF